jgi:hypothetical protein
VISSPRTAPDELGQYYPPTYYAYLPRMPTRKSQFFAKLRAYKSGYPPKDGLIGRMFWQTTAYLFGNFFLFYLPYRGAGKTLLEIGLEFQTAQPYLRAEDHETISPAQTCIHPATGNIQRCDAHCGGEPLAPTGTPAERISRRRAWFA